MGLWQEVLALEDMTIAGGGVVNAAHFAGRARSARGPRRVAAVALALLFAALALEAVLRLTPGVALLGPIDAGARAVLAASVLAVTTLVLVGARR